MILIVCVSRVQRACDGLGACPGHGTGHGRGVFHDLMSGDDHVIFSQVNAYTGPVTETSYDLVPQVIVSFLDSQCKGYNSLTL